MGFASRRRGDRGSGALDCAFRQRVSITGLLVASLFLQKAYGNTLPLLRSYYCERMAGPGPARGCLEQQHAEPDPGACLCDISSLRRRCQAGRRARHCLRDQFEPAPLALGIGNTPHYSLLGAKYRLHITLPEVSSRDPFGVQALACTEAVQPDGSGSGGLQCAGAG